MKKLTALLLIAFVFMFSTQAFAFSLQDLVNSIHSIVDITTDKLVELKDLVAKKFSDVDKNGWYIGTISKLFGLGIINGYPDETFRPNGQITRGEFTKMLVYAMGYKEAPTNENHWAAGVREKAIELGWLDKGEFEDLNKPITRLEIASMIARATDESVDNLAAYENQLTDFNTIEDDTLRNRVVKCYALGIIKGYPDGTFKPYNTATRAEASTMIVRLLDKSERVVPETVTLHFTQEELQGKSDEELVSSDLILDTPPQNENFYNVDLAFIILMHKPLEPQWNDAEKLLVKRFGEKAKPIVSYIKSKQNETVELPAKYWTIDDKLIKVEGTLAGWNIGVTVWNNQGRDRI
ncbi:MAG: S-layer homology domain-containing protein [Thermosipho sp. (in: Bacteria)]|nr:S-layer homology domain-containing protein [Thermosipho sp. (in: thermotogales)]